MGMALELSFYTFVLMVFIGLIVSVGFFRWIFGGRNPLSVFPQLKSIESKSFKEGKNLLDKLKEQLSNASPDQKDTWQKEIQLLQNILEDFKIRNEYEQRHFQKLWQEHEASWHQLDQLVSEMSFLQRIKGKARHPDYQNGKKDYFAFEEQIDEELRQLKLLDELHMKELRDKGVYQRTRYLLYSDHKSDPSNIPFEQESSGSLSDDNKESSSEEHLDELSHSTQEDPPIPSSQEQQISQQKAPAKNTKEIGQNHFPFHNMNVRNKIYIDSTFSLKFEPDNTLRYYDFEDTSFQKVNFIGLHQYENCSFHKTNFSLCQWMLEAIPHRFAQCNLKESQFFNSHLKYIVFHQCDFTFSQWARSTLYKIKFLQCNLEGIDWTGIDLSNVVMSKEMFDTLNFEGCLQLPRNHPDRSSDFS